MANKPFILSFLLLLCWMMIVKCQDNLTTQNPMSDETTDEKWFNETISEVVLMTEEVDTLINLLSSGTMSEGGHHVRNPLAMVPFLIAGLCLSSVSIVILIGTSAYNIWRNEKNAKLAEQARLKEDERFKALMAENAKLFNEVTRIVDGVHTTASEIVAKLDQVIQTIIQQDFATKITDPMSILMETYKTYTKTLANQALVDLNVTCQKYVPKDIIAIMKSKTTEMYKQQLTESIFDEGYDLITRLEDGYLLQYSILYPYCTMLANFDKYDAMATNYGAAINETILDIIKIVNHTVNSALEPRNDANAGRNSRLWTKSSTAFWDVYLGDDERSVIFSAPSDQACANNIYDFMVYNFNSLKEPISGSNYTYLVTVVSDVVFNVTLNSSVNHNYIDYKVKQGNIFIYAQEKFEYPAPECDFLSTADGGLPSNVKEEFWKMHKEDQNGGIKNFMQKHCKYTSLITHARLCMPPLIPCKKVFYKESQNFNVIVEENQTFDPPEFDLVYIFYS